MIDVERCDRLARKACRGLYGEDLEDLLQEARLAVWQAGDVSDALAILIARRRTIDAWRKMTGYRSKSRRRRRTESLDVEGVPVPTAEDHRLPASDMGLTGRQAVLVDGLALGFRRCELADMLGVTPSRVSQLLHNITT